MGGMEYKIQISSVPRQGFQSLSLSLSLYFSISLFLYFSISLFLMLPQFTDQGFGVGQLKALDPGLGDS